MGEALLGEEKCPRRYRRMKEAGAQTPGARSTGASKYYAAGVSVLVLGVIVFIALFVTGFLGVNQTRLRVRVPGETILRFDTPGNYTIFHEYRGFLGEESFDSAPLLRGIGCELTSESSGERISLEPVGPDQSYTARRRKGVSIFKFTLEYPGEYRIGTWFKDGVEQQAAVVSFMEWRRGQVQLLLIRSWAVFAVFLIAGLSLIAAGARRRRRFV